MPKISVIVPVYNVEQYLSRCIDSILNQTYKDFEVLLIDDGSLDGSSKICDFYSEKDSRITVIHQENQGLSFARNTGIEYSLRKNTSEWIAFVDSDDWIHEHYLKFLYSAATKHEASIVVCDYLKTTEIGMTSEKINEVKIELINSTKYYIENNTSATVVWNKLYSAKLFSDSSCRFPIGKIHEDEFFSYKLFDSCNRNQEIDFLIFTDQDLPNGVCVNQNIKWNKLSFDGLKELINSKLSINVNLKRPYKLCDLKPFYGLIFDEYILEYKYWGYGDWDVIYGRITSFLQKIAWEKYDKINWMSHLTLIKNNKQWIDTPLLRVPGTHSAEEVLSTEFNLGYDERDFNIKCLFNGMKIYNGQWAADIDIFYGRMRCVDLKTYHLLLDTKKINYAPHNYRKQIFILMDGRVCRFYIRGLKVYHDEFAYIHFRKEAKIMFSDLDRKSYIISRNGFIKVNIDKLNDLKYMQEQIKLYNSGGSLFSEIHDFLYQYYRKISGKRGW